MLDSQIQIAFKYSSDSRVPQRAHSVLYSLNSFSHPSINRSCIKITVRVLQLLSNFYFYPRSARSKCFVFFLLCRNLQHGRKVKWVERERGGLIFANLEGSGENEDTNFILSKFFKLITLTPGDNPILEYFSLKQTKLVLNSLTVRYTFLDKLNLALGKFQLMPKMPQKMLLTSKVVQK